MKFSISMGIQQQQTPLDPTNQSSWFGCMVRKNRSNHTIKLFFIFSLSTTDFPHVN